MSSPVRLRGEVGERRKGLEKHYPNPVDFSRAWSHTGERSIDDPWMYRDRRLSGTPRRDRRQSPSIAARFEECMEIAKAPLLQALEEAAVKIASLEGRVAGLQESLERNLAHYRAQEGSYDEGA